MNSTIIIIEQNCIRGRWINEFTAKTVTNGAITTTEIITPAMARQIHNQYRATRIGHKRAWFAVCK